MDSSTTEILHDFSPLIRVFKDGRVERMSGTESVPASFDPATGVQSKDVKINDSVSARLYLPKSVKPDEKLPLLVYFHGGGFVIATAFSPLYHTHLNNLVAEANIIVVSVDYRRAPEHPLPIAYEDSWTALQWIASHSSRTGQEPWLSEHVDFQSVFFAGDSAGGNIAHNMAIRVGIEKPDGFNVKGIALVHSYFWGQETLSNEPVEPKSRDFLDRIWFFVKPDTNGLDDPLINPASDPRLSSLGCKRVIIFVAEQDVLKHRGLYYKELLDKSGWGGKVEVVETKDENHVFHLFNPTTDKAVSLVRSVASFINQENSM
ncbi:Arylacetamide deacetylase [Heracleum sosnowskyi]|uniref:Arylacetamide deacetylase n=1 Tax=Heracleum sosnowskyi TaxID=360622 RepID=A0AAD8JEU2_9APIA|nr:Arylacetamide deacetylase [Heracleum sosnowskyi]